MKFKYFLLLYFIALNSSFSQQLEFSGAFTGKGIVFSGEESPFWLHSNQRGRVNELTNFSTVLSGLVKYSVSENSTFSIGVGGLYQDGYNDEVQLDESYIAYTTSWLEAYIGRKQREELYHGLSATNENILWSLNSRPLPGISLRMTRPIYFWKNGGVGFKASLEEFITDDERYVPDTRVHHKSFHLYFNKVRNFEFHVGLEHFVQWAGVSPVHGKLPGDFNSYIKMFAGQEGNDDVGGQEANALGNHLGSYVAGIKTSIDRYNIEIIYNHLFEDGSGRVLRNTPDGRYGIYLVDKTPGKWVEAMMYEFYYTKNQSKSSPTTDGIDNYFNNNLYRSGWTYEQRILGVPFIILDEDRFRVNNNMIAAHHLGIAGVAFDALPYKLLTSYRKNYGSKGSGRLRSDIFSGFLDLKVYQNAFDLSVNFGVDINSVAKPNFGGGIELSKRLF